MKKIYTFYTLLLTSIFSQFQSFAQTYTFSYTGAMQFWTVPAGVHAIAVDVQGAKGGAAGPASSIIGVTTPGCGGRVQASLTVTPGEVLNINVGGTGMDGVGYAISAGGYNGGGMAKPWSPVVPSYTGGGGGGKTDISSGGITLVVAGGGGGAGYNGTCSPTDQHGADGGGATAASITTCDAALFTAGITTIRHAGGGTQTTGGIGGYLAPTAYHAGTSGTLGTGGDNVDSGGIGGGGGGGYYGGGGGCWSGGGGGSSYAIPGLANAVVHTPGYNCGAGLVSICILNNPGFLVGLRTLCPGDTATWIDSAGTIGGTWASGATSTATVGSAGFISGIAGGTAAISYLVNTPGCGTAYAIDSIRINPLPALSAISGRDTVCPGHHTSLSDTATGGTWSSGTTAKATIGSTTGIVTGVTAGSSIITYSVTRLGCTSKTTVNVVVSSALPCVSSVNDPGDVAVELKAYPDPSYGRFTASLTSAENISVRFTVTNMMGRKMQEYASTSNKQQVIQLDAPPGIYLLTATTDIGIWQQKISIVR